VVKVIWLLLRLIWLEQKVIWEHLRLLILSFIVIEQLISCQLGIFVQELVGKSRITQRLVCVEIILKLPPATGLVVFSNSIVKCGLFKDLFWFGLFHHRLWQIFSIFMQKLVSSFLSIICIFLTVMFQIDDNRILLLVFFWNFSKFGFFLVAKSWAVPRIVLRLLLGFGNLNRVRLRIPKHLFKLSVKLLHFDFFLLALINFCNVVFFLRNFLILFLLTNLIWHADYTLILQSWGDISLSVRLSKQTHSWLFHNNRFSRWLDYDLFLLTFVICRGYGVLIVSNIFLIMMLVDLSCVSRTFFLNFYFLTLCTFFFILWNFNSKLDFFNLGIFGGQEFLLKVRFKLLIALLLPLLQNKTLSVWNSLISLFEVLFLGHLSSFFIQFFQIVRNT